jgi:hypothetical protein
MKSESTLLLPNLVPPDLAQLQDTERAEMLSAGREVQGCMRALERVGCNFDIPSPCFTSQGFLMVR